MRSGSRIGLACALVAIAGSAAAFGPLVRSAAGARARRQGLELRIGAVRPGWGRIWLRDVDVRIPEVPSVRASLASVEVVLTARLGVAAVLAHGGRVTVGGGADVVAGQLGAWRAKHAHAAAPVAPAESAKLAVDGVYVGWEDVVPGSSARLWGLGFARSGGEEHVSASLARAAWPGGSLQATDAQLALVRRDGQRWVDHVAVKRLSLALDVDSARFRRALAAVHPDAKPRDGAAAEARRLQPTRGPRLRAALARVAAVVQTALRPAGAVDVDGLRVNLRHGQQALNLGPGRLHVARAGDRVALALTPGSADQKAPLTLRLAIPFGDKPVTIDVEGGPVSLASLGVQPGDLGLMNLDRATIAARAAMKLSADGGELGFTSNGNVANLAIDKQWLAPQPVTGVALGWRGSGTVRLDGGRLQLDDGELDVGKVRLVAKGQVERGDDFTRVSLEGGVPLASCQDMLDSVPQGLMPLIEGMRSNGTFSLEGRLQLDTRHPDDMLTRWSVANECRITAVPPRISPRRFQQPWSRAVKGASGELVTIQSGPGTPSWVPRFAISKHMETALLVCEDAGFWRHHGFDEEAIRNSIRDDVKAGRFLRGASTLSMQLAKNLYLSPKKYLSRKLQEAVLTMLLEQELTKDQILELYLNVVEFGPGIFGIGPAARHYFNTTPAQLSLGQSLYIASILPNPRVQHFGADGNVSPGWTAYLRKLMRIAYRIHRVTDDELEAGLSEQITFGVPYHPGDPTGPAPRDDDQPHDEAAYGSP